MPGVAATRVISSRRARPGPKAGARRLILYSTMGTVVSSGNSVNAA